MIQPPVGPRELTATALSSSEIVLTWVDQSDNETEFVIQRGHAVPDAWDWSESVGADVTTFTDRGVFASNTYEYRVCSQNTAGSSDWISTTVQTPAPPPPSAPSGVTVTALSTTALQIDWVDNSDNEHGFRVLRSDDGVAPYSEVGFLNANVTTHTDNGLTPDTLRYYQICAWNSDGEVCSDAASGRTLPITFALTITIVPAGSGTVTADPQLDRYPIGTSVALTATPIGDYQFVGWSGNVTGTANPESVLMSTARAVTATFAIPALPPPTGLTASRGTSLSNVSVSWNAVTGATSYNLYRYEGADQPTLATLVGASLSSTSQTDYPSKQGVDYYYYVSTIGAGGEGAKSAGYSGYKKMDAPTGVLASDGTSACVVVSWSYVFDAATYYIYRNTASRGTSITSPYSDCIGASTTSMPYTVKAVGQNGSTSDHSVANNGYRN